MVDSKLVLSILGPGWVIDAGPAVVTKTDQSNFGTPLPKGCGFINKVDLIGVDTEGENIYAPPLGWSVISASNVAKNEQEDLWISPQGTIYNVSSCMTMGGVGVGGAKLNFPLLVIGVLVLAILFWPSKKK